jgi:TPR repeat protein
LQAVTDPVRPDDSLEPLWQKVDEAAQRGDFSGVLFVLKTLADKGVWQAYGRIGEIYETGGGNVVKDPEQALKWYRRAVFEGDDPVGHLGLGRAYYDGTNVERDFSLALTHFKKAFAAGLPPAGIYLGIMYYSGIGVDRDIFQAREYFEFAVSHDYFIAYFYLARIAFSQHKYFHGLTLCVKGWLLGARVTKQDPGDPRLLGAEMPVPRVKK